MGFQHSWRLAGDNHWWLFKHWDPVLLHNVMNYVSTNMLYTSTCQQGTTLLCPLGSHQRSCPVLVVLPSIPVPDPVSHRVLILMRTLIHFY